MKNDYALFDDDLKSDGNSYEFLCPVCKEYQINECNNGFFNQYIHCYSCDSDIHFYSNVD